MDKSIIMGLAIGLILVAGIYGVQAAIGTAQVSGPATQDASALGQIQENPPAATTSSQSCGAPACGEGSCNGACGGTCGVKSCGCSA